MIVNPDLAQVVRETTRKVDKELGIQNGFEYTVLPIAEGPGLLFEDAIQRLAEQNGKSPNIFIRGLARLASYVYFNTAQVKNACGCYTHKLPEYFFLNPDKLNSDNFRLAIGHELTHARIDDLRRKDPEYTLKSDYFSVLYSKERFDLEEPFCNLMGEHITGEGRILELLGILYDRCMSHFGDIKSIKLDDPSITNQLFVYSMFRQEGNWNNILDFVVNPFETEFLKQNPKKEVIKAIKEGRCLRYSTH